MPVLSEMEQRMFVGGSGGGSGVLTWDPNANLTASTDAEKLGLLNQLMGMLGYTSSLVLTTLMKDGIPQDTTDAGTPSSGSNTIFFNKISNRWTTGNVYDIALILVHEKNHIDTSWNNYVPGNWNEVEAYRAEYMHSLFQYASPAYKSAVIARSSF
jgi:hypothetical protein